MNELEELLAQVKPSPTSPFTNKKYSPAAEKEETPLFSLFNNKEKILTNSDNSSPLDMINLIPEDKISSTSKLMDRIKEKNKKIISHEFPSVENKKMKRTETDSNVVALSDREINCIPESKQRKSKNSPSKSQKSTEIDDKLNGKLNGKLNDKLSDSMSEKLSDKFSENFGRKDDEDDDDDDGGPVGLGIRQPSFSNLTTGHLIPKGLDEADINLDKVEEEDDPVIVLTKKTEVQDVLVGLNVRQSSMANFNLTSNNINDEYLVDKNENTKQNNQIDTPLFNEVNIAEVLAKRNAERYKKMGYDPNMNMVRNNSLQNFQLSSSLEKKNTPYRNSSMATFFPISSISENGNEINKLSPNKNTRKIKRVTSSGIEYYDDKQNCIYDSKNNFEDESDEIDEQANNKSKNEKRNEKTCKDLNNGWNANPFTPGLMTPDIEMSEENTPQLPADFHLDLHELAETRGYDDDKGSQRIPERLRYVIEQETPRISQESVTYLALCGIDIVGYRESKVQDAIVKMRQIEKKCIYCGFVNESAYVQDILDNTIKKLKDLKRYETMPSHTEANNNLISAQNEYALLTKAWESKKAEINTELELALNDLKMKFEHEKNEINKKWNSKSLKNRYNKPSPTLIDMKYVAKKMMNQHRFEEVAQVAKTIKRKEINESNEASDRMKKGYQSALNQLKKKYAIEEKTIRSQFDTRLSQAERQAKIEMLPFQRKVDKFSTKKENIEETMRRNPEMKKTKTRGVSILKRSSKLPPNITIGLNTKLNLKSVVPTARSIKSSKSPKSSHSRIMRPVSQMRNRSSESSLM
ncbi:hypothetical protein TRFO_28048 [Tritrichomonas foetus]|uniref:Uncharacterized protein n=1 Tax=Tritrichomonas foetus TaxID=1144522 RepID=A0A1J4JZS3_9EUKA|nr:hypothetical protein TRFO_28048 [Tritrichomonas foetus]|eukprot:OHT04483.1 hypothetical protein TRFO_28048 [Tritrichomonas foetus]